jgi:hypothetical protein
VNLSPPLFSTLAGQKSLVKAEALAGLVITPTSPSMNSRLATLIALLGSLLLSNAQSKKGPGKEDSIIITESSLVGYWMADSTALAEMLMIQQKAEIESRATTKAKIEEQAKDLASMMVMHYSGDGQTSMHTVSGTKTGKYKIVEVRKEQQELDVDIQSESDGKEQGTMRFAKDRMTLSSRGAGKGGPMITLKRITEEEAKEMIKKIKSK